MPAAAFFCAACRMLRPVAELLAFWPRVDATRIRFVCRPSLQRNDIPPCFRDVIGPSSQVAIEFADQVVGVAA